MGDVIKNLFTREEMEYDLPGDEEHYVAKATNRFRDSWYDVHLLHSFWRVTETTKSVHSWMKIPGAFGMARACVGLKPDQIEPVILKLQQTGGKTTVQSVLNDKDTPQTILSLRSVPCSRPLPAWSAQMATAVHCVERARPTRCGTGPLWSSSHPTLRTRSNT